MTTFQGPIFISYARRDGEAYAKRLESALRNCGFEPWRDRRNLNPDYDFTVQLERAIQNSTHMVCCITPDTQRDDSYVRREIGYAQRIDKPIVPLVFQNTLPPLPIINVTHIDFSAKAWDVAVDELCERLRRMANEPFVPPIPPPEPYRMYLNSLYDAINDLLEQTNTFDDPIPLQSESRPDAVTAATRPTMLRGMFRVAGKSLRGQITHFRSFREAFDQYQQRVLLLGDPGAGKTTTLLAFARDAVAARLTDPALPLPVLTALATWDAEQRTPLAEWLVTQLEHITSSDLNHLIQTGAALLLLDGLDELGGERVEVNAETGEKTHFDPRLRFIQALPPQTPIVVSCRVYDYEQIGHKIDLNGAVQLQPFDDDQMRQYLQNAPDLWQVLETDAELRNLVRSPLDLNTFIYAFNGSGETVAQLKQLNPAERRDKMYEFYVQRRYEHEELKLRAQLPFSLAAVNDALGKLAINNAGDWKRPENVLKSDDLAEAVGRANVAAFAELATRLKLLVSIERDQFRFFHLRLRDYYVFRYAPVYLRHANWGERNKAIYALGKVRDVRAVDLLLDALKDTSGYVRSAAVATLGSLGDRRASGPLLAALRDLDPLVFHTASDALGELKDPATVEPLLSMVRGTIPKGKGVAAHALGKMGEMRAVEPLVAMLKDRNPSLRCAPAASLGYLHAAEAVDDLIPLLADNTLDVGNINVLASQRAGRKIYSGNVCEVVAEALERIGTPQALQAVAEWRRKRP